MTARGLVFRGLATAAVVGAGWTLAPRAEEPVAVPTAPAVVAAQARDVGVLEAAQQTLLTAEDDRLQRVMTGLRPDSAPYVHRTEGAETLVLTARGLSYGLADLVTHGAATEQFGGSVLLERHVLIAPGAHLSVDAPGTDLRLRSDRFGITSLVAWKADLELNGSEGEGLEVTSWDPAERAPDTTTEDGRAYVRVVSGSLHTAHVHATRLGFWAGRTGGVALTGGSSGPAEGTLTNSTFDRGHYGVFASATADLAVTESRFVGNAVDGLSLHRSTVGVSVTGSVASGNGRHGISADQGSEDVRLTGVTAARNVEYGVHLSGAPLSDGPSAGGASLRAYGHFTVTGGHLIDNGKAGARIVEADHVTVVGTSLRGNRDGVVLVDTAAPTTVAGTTIEGDHRFGVTTTGGAATITGNRVVGARTPIRVRDASAAVLGNAVERATEHGISVVGTSVQTSVLDNRIGGRGPSGLDLHRLAPGVTVEQSDNDVDGWVRDRDNWVYWSSFLPNHPMLLLWVVTLGVPLALRLRARRRRAPVGVFPYRDDVRRDREPPMRFSSGRPLSSGGPA